MIEIILTTKPEQLFSLPINGVFYNCRVLYNTRSTKWSIDINQGEVGVVMGVPLVSGVDLLSQHIVGWDKMFMLNMNDTANDPGRSDIGNGARLILTTEEELGNG